MTYYDDITYLLNKYSTKQPDEIWSPKSERNKDEIVRLNRKLELFEGINSEYYRLKGSQIDRAKFIISRINFNDVCPRCSSEQMIVLICYFVKCEYDKYFNRKNCKKVFTDYNISDNLLDRFMLFMARYGINNTILDKNFLLKTPLYSKKE